MQGQALAMLLGRHFPQFLDANAIGLLFGLGPQVKLLDQGFGQRAARALGENGLLGAQFHAWHVHVGLLAIFANAHVAGDHSAH